jgi:hypothetical protein
VFLRLSLIAQFAHNSPSSEHSNPITGGAGSAADSRLRICHPLKLTLDSLSQLGVALERVSYRQGNTTVFAVREAGCGPLQTSA